MTVAATRLCRCGHRVENHAAVLVPKGGGRRNDDPVTEVRHVECLDPTCDCIQCHETERPPGWIVALRVIEHAFRNNYSVGVSNKKLAHCMIWSVSVGDMPNGQDFNAPMTLSEEGELCEMLGSRLLEHAELAMNPTVRAEVDKAWYERLQRRCPTCDAAVARSCTPVHAGERRVGRWTHPARHAEPRRQRLDGWKSALTGIGKPSNNHVGAARQTCTICSGTGVAVDGSGPRRCTCAAGAQVNTNTAAMRGDVPQDTRMLPALCKRCQTRRVEPGGGVCRECLIEGAWKR